MKDPWDKIESSKKDGEIKITRVVESSHKHKFWRGKDFYGQYVFQFEGCFTPQQFSLPSSSSISIRIVQRDHETSDLIFTLLDAELKNLFRALTLDMIEVAAASGLSSDEAIAHHIVTHFKRWQRLLKSAKSDLLSSNKILGLVGELRVLRDFLIANTSLENSLSAWGGPLGDKQDFNLNGKMLEVKSKLVSQNMKVEISSAEQLDAANGNIFLCLQLFTCSTDSGDSLNEIVNEIRGLLLNVDTRYSDDFENKLLELGYVTRDEYDGDKYSLAQRDIYSVHDGFPAIATSALSALIDNVSYRIDMSGVAEFIIPTEKFIKELFDE